jgi:hypothetical protein
MLMQVYRGSVVAIPDLALSNSRFRDWAWIKEIVAILRQRKSRDRAALLSSFRRALPFKNA